MEHSAEDDLVAARREGPARSATLCDFQSLRDRLARADVALCVRRIAQRLREGQRRNDGRRVAQRDAVGTRRTRGASAAVLGRQLIRGKGLQQSFVALRRGHNVDFLTAKGEKTNSDAMQTCGSWLV